MSHIKDLHLNILRRVLACFYYGTMKGYNLQEFRQLLPPAAVCRVWRECMLPYVYYRAHLEYHIKETDEDNKAENSTYEWKSNIDLIVSQRFNSTVRRLCIESFEYPLNFTDMIHALDGFGFSSAHWRAVNALYFNMAYEGVAINDSASSSSNDEALEIQLTEYFGRHVPNIGSLDIYIEPLSYVTQLLSNKLVNLYMHQLHSLSCYPAPITFDCFSFSSKLSHLTVGIAPGIINRLPQMLASPLEYLVLFDIPHNFAWWTFIGIAPGHIEFTNLTFLQLHFRQLSENAEESSNSNRQVSMSTVSLNIGSRKLFFPKLEELRIFNSPYSDDAFYSMLIHPPLQHVKIYSSFKSVQHMDPSILFNASDIVFDIHSVSPEDFNDSVEFYHKLLGTRSNARVAWLGIHQSSMPLSIPNTFEWINLEYLYLATNIHLASVVQVVTQLPTLHTIHIENVVDEANEAGANMQAILIGSSTQLPSIATNVKNLSIYSLPTRIGSVNYSPRRRPLVFSLDVMCYLTVLIRSLDKVVVPDLYVSDINKFAVHYADSFPHLHLVKVLCASEEHGW